MAEVPKELRSLLFGDSPRLLATMSQVLVLIALACLIVGIVAAAIDNKLGLGATNWMLVAIAVFVWSLSAWLAAYFGAKEG